MSVTLGQIEQIAPDQASLKAASGLRSPAKWSGVGRDDEASLLWGECQGSGSAPYLVCATTDDLGFRCSCPSRKLPCKHVLALLWQHVEQPTRFATAATPEWVTNWLARRRPRAGGAADSEAEDRPENEKSLQLAATVEPEAPVDEQAAVRAARQRERTRATREAAVLDGLEELERWIGDQLAGGLMSFVANSIEQCRVVSRRLIDAKAPALAATMDSLPDKLFAMPKELREDFAIDRLGMLALLSKAYRRQDALAPELANDIRRAIGWAPRREELLADPAVMRFDAVWRVLATRSEVQPDQLRRLETWLARETDASAEKDAPQFALLLDYVATGAGKVVHAFEPGERFSATLAFYPSATPLRALLVERVPVATDRPASPAMATLSAAYSSYLANIARNPFILEWPIAAGGTRIEDRDQSGSWLVDDSLELRVAPAQQARLLPLSGLVDMKATGLWNGQILTLLTAETPYGIWQDA